MRSTPVGICVFCGSKPGHEPAYAAAARQLGQLLAAGAYDVVYGGSSDGCMGALADGALSLGGRVIGVAPTFVGVMERRHPGLTRLDSVADLAQRKIRMLELSAAVIVLPGGTGTLDEFLEVLTMKRLALLRHPLLVIDVEGFFTPLQSLLRHLIEEGFMGPEQRELYRVVSDPASAVDELQMALEHNRT